LGGLCISTVYKHERSERIRKSEAAKLQRIKVTMIIIEYHTAAHNEYADIIGTRNEAAQSVCPSGVSTPLIQIEP